MKNFVDYLEQAKLINEGFFGFGGSAAEESFKAQLEAAAMAVENKYDTGSLSSVVSYLLKLFKTASDVRLLNEIVQKREETLYKQKSQGEWTMVESKNFELWQNEYSKIYRRILEQVRQILRKAISSNNLNANVSQYAGNVLSIIANKEVLYPWHTKQYKEKEKATKLKLPKNTANV